jgi:Transposase DDE domain
VAWLGYQVHRTETCEPAPPHVLVNGETTPATTPAEHMVAPIHASLKPRGLLPAEHWVAKGSPDSQVFVDRPRRSGVTLRGPVADEPRWQARAGPGFEKAHVLVDGDREVVTCPMGKPSLSRLPHPSPQHGRTWAARLARKACTPCRHRAQGTRSKKEPRIVGRQAREPYEALHAARPHQTTAACAQQDAPRAGLEGPHEPGRRRCGLRQARAMGLAKTHVPPIATAAALTLIRRGEW